MHLLYVCLQGATEPDLSDDELPPDVDLSDPFFAEELAATGGQFIIQSFSLIGQSFISPLVAVFRLFWILLSINLRSFRS